jgi:hypothetical protein
MKRLIATIASSLFAAGVSAADIYHELGKGNSDLPTQSLSAADFVGVQPSTGDSVSRYHGWEEGNPDLFKTEGSGMTEAGKDPDIYKGLGGNSDLEF